MNRIEFATEFNTIVPSIDDAMTAALAPIFNIPLPLETGFESNVLVEGIDESGHVSIYTRRGIVVEARYTNLTYDRTTSAWWVTIDRIETHDDPAAFEDM